MYRTYADRLVGVLARNKIEIKGAKVLELAPGVGYFTGLFDRRSPGGLTGIDITKESVELLRARYPKYTFEQGDITDPALVPAGGPFALASAFSVVFHILDDDKFFEAIANIGKALKPGGYAIWSDNLPKESTEAKGHVRFRALSLHEEALTAAGLDLVEVVPINYWGAEPVAESDFSGLESAQEIWKRLSHHARKSEFRGWLAGLLFYLKNRERKPTDHRSYPFSKFVEISRLRLQ